MQPHLLPSDQATGYSQDEWSNGLIRYGSRFVPSSRCISHFGKVFEKSIRGLSVGIIYNKAMSQHDISTTCPIWPPQPMVSVYLWEALEEENRNTKSNQYLYVRLSENKSASALVLYSCMLVCSRATAKAPSIWWVSSIPVKTPTKLHSVNIMVYYDPFSDVFCLWRATQLTPHTVDCGTARWTLYQVKNLSILLPIRHDHKDYIQEALQQGYFHVSTCPAISSFFFADKKDWEPLHDYRKFKSLSFK